MSVQSIGKPLSPPRHSPDPGTRRVATLEHRTFVHPVTNPDCVECLPNPCVCGQVLCPDAFEHRRELVSSERYWVEVAR